MRALDARNYAAAAEGFRRVYELDPDGPLADEALFWRGTAQDLGAESALALRTYELLSSRFPNSARTRTALVRRARLYAFMERYSLAGRVADEAFARFSDLRPFEHITLLGAKALALVEAGDVDKAEHYVEQARTLIENHGLDAAGSIPRDLAQIYFALGETRRVRAERIRFVPLPANFAGVLEQRCQLILDAQSSYSDTMRAEDAHWSAMAGYRVGELYQRLHDDLMQVPPPATASSAERAQLFEGAMRLRYSILLEKARSMMTHTIEMGRRTGERSVWIAKAEQSVRDLDEAVRREQAALDALPYSRPQLERALEDLSKKASTPKP
jgi:tetratricopeptide (TPR) repeat protein